MKKQLTKELIRKMYFDEKLSMYKIADNLGYCVQTIHKYFHLYNFKPIKRGEAWNSGKTCFDDSRILSGSKHPRWKDRNKYYIEFKLKRKEIINGKTQCSKCNNIANILHHKDKNTKNNNYNNLLPLCSSCHTTLHNKQRGITVYKHNCEWCKKEFTVLSVKNCKQRFCSLSCKSKHSYYKERSTLPKNRGGKTIYFHTCKWCNKLFPSINSNQIFCSYSCSGKGRKHRN